MEYPRRICNLYDYLQNRKERDEQTPLYRFSCHLLKQHLESSHFPCCPFFNWIMWKWWPSMNTLVNWLLYSFYSLAPSSCLACYLHVGEVKIKLILQKLVNIFTSLSHLAYRGIVYGWLPKLMDNCYVVFAISNTLLCILFKFFFTALSNIKSCVVMESQ